MLTFPQSAVRTALVLAGTFITAFAMPMHAQSPARALLLHGFPGQGADLATLENSLLGTFSTAISPRRPTVSNQHNGLANWPSQLTPFVAGADTQTVAIAHSTGGVAARAVDRAMNGSLYGAITFGSPLGGAPIANNRFSAYYWMQSMRGAILGLINEYTGWMVSGEEWMVDAGFGYFQIQSFQALESVFAPTLIAQTSTDLQTNSSYLAAPSGLNGSANLAREAAALGSRRLAIVARAPSSIQVCAGVSNLINRQDCTNGQSGAITSFVAMGVVFGGYDNQSNPNAAQIVAHADEWFSLADAVYFADQTYCYYIAPNDTEGLGCRADGYIGESAQKWPGVAIALNIPDVGGHSEEPTKAVVANAVIDLMRNQLDIQPPGPPPPQWNAVIQGQSTIAPSAQCTWWGTTSGTGDPGAVYSYTWKVNGVTQQTGSQASLTYGNPNPPFMIDLTITAQNGTRNASLWVELDANGWCQ